MDLPKIYNFLDSKYQPFVRYVFSLPTRDFYSFLESIKNEIGLGGEFHGFEVEKNNLEFWDFSNGDERVVEINFKEFVDLIYPLKNVIVKEQPELMDKIETILVDILESTT